MNKNKSIVKIIMIVSGIFFIGCFLVCLGIGSFFISDSEIQTPNNKNNSEYKTKLLKDKKIAKIKNTKKSTTTKLKATTKKPTPTATPKKTATKKPVSQLNDQLKILKENFKDSANIKYKKDIKIIEIIPIEKSFMLEAMQAYNGDIEKTIIWNDLVESIRKISQQIEDNQISIVIVNNLNSENYLLIIQDGIVLYDFINS